jgi:serine phosphatase RsbU (regulator of sigma subunit)
MAPLPTMDDMAREVARSETFAHGFLAAVDGDGRVLFHSSGVSDAWLARHGLQLAQGADGQGEDIDAYGLTRRSVHRWGVRVVAGVFRPDLIFQTMKLVGSSLSFLGVVIVLALCLAWLLARRLIEALAEADRSRVEAEAAKAKAEAASAELAAELEQASRYVQSLLPQRVRHGPVKADWLYIPSVGVGGDAFGYLWLDDTRFAFYLLDVCGHGVGAALLSTTVMNVIRSRTLAGGRFDDPSWVLSALNTTFPMEAHNGMYFTIWYGVYDTVAGSVRYAAAGHHPAVLIAPGAEPQMLQGRGLPIGCFPDVDYPVAEVSVPPGGRLYVFSDGIFEVELNARRDMLSFEAFVDIIREWRTLHDDRDLVYVLETVQGIQGKPNFDDDCALMELAFSPVRRVQIAA